MATKTKKTAGTDTPQVNNNTAVSETPARVSSWQEFTEKFNTLVGNYAGGLTPNAFYDAFARASRSIDNNTPIQNSRIKAISSLPCDYSKEEIGNFLRTPYAYERQLRQTAEVLKWTDYPFFKILKATADIPTYNYYFSPKYIDSVETAKSKEFMREAYLLDKFNKEFRPEVLAHEAVMKAGSQGKVAYTFRYGVDKVHNRVTYAMWQQLPSDYCYIIGKNSKSGWTISFNMMYFMKIGTTPSQFGDLFDPFLEDFDNMFRERKTEGYTRYASESDSGIQLDCKGNKLNFYPTNINPQGYGKPRVFMQDGTWQYYVSLPADKVFVFEIDESTPAVASPYSGLLLTFSQQADYEAAQLSLILNPLVMFLTGEIEYFDSNGSTTEDGFRLSAGARQLFETLFYNMLSDNNTSGIGWYTAPVKNIKSHQFPESANSNEISRTFNEYGMEKAGLAALIPVSKDIKASQVDASCKIEGRFATATIYPQIKRLMETIYERMNLNFEWKFEMLGDIFSKSDLMDVARKDLDKGDISAFYRISALEGESWLDKISQLYAMKASGIMQLLEVPQTAYTQSGKGEGTNGRPTGDGMSDSKEHSIDSGVNNE